MPEHYVNGLTLWGNSIFSGFANTKTLRRIFETTRDEVTEERRSYKIGIFKMFTFHPIMLLYCRKYPWERTTWKTCERGGRYRRNSSGNVGTVLNWHWERPMVVFFERLKKFQVPLNWMFFFQLNEYYLLFRKTGTTFNRKKNIHTKETYKHTLQRESNFNHDTT
jgi:hypothetical protein